MQKFTISINDIECKANENETILQVAQRENIFIPALCYHCDLTIHESCRLCMVEIEGLNGLRPSCSIKATPEMRVRTSSPEIDKAMRINLELLFAQHKDKCATCDRRENCKLHELINKHPVSTVKYDDRKKNHKKYQFGPSIVFDSSKCINCEDCSEMCAKQTDGGFLRPRESKYNFEVCPSHDKEHDCIYCGQCIMHCPVGALTEKTDYPEVKKLLENKSKKVIFQIAPAIRTSIGEEFDLPVGTIVTDKLLSAIKKIGAYKAFDASFAADVTIIEEGRELIEKIQAGGDVMLSSCCPAWVKYVEFYEPELIPYLTTVRSPQIIMGGLIKKYWAPKHHLDPKEIVVVSIMPCTAKKFEATRRELFIDGTKPVDFVLTTRELAKLFKEFDVNLADIEANEKDNDILANPSGAGEIFGTSGGVLEAALRTVYHELTGKNLANLEFHQLHQYKNTKHATVKIGESSIRVVAVNGIENVKKIIEEIKRDPKRYQYVEVMACPGGCIGGGGQPIPTTHEIRQARANNLYHSDWQHECRTSHENPGITKIYDEYLSNKNNSKKVCTTHYIPKNKGKLTSK